MSRGIPFAPAPMDLIWCELCCRSLWLEKRGSTVEWVVVQDNGEGIEFATLGDITAWQLKRIFEEVEPIVSKGQHGRGVSRSISYACNATLVHPGSRNVDAVIEVAEPTIKDFEAWLIDETDQKHEP